MDVNDPTPDQARTILDRMSRYWESIMREMDARATANGTTIREEMAKDAEAFNRWSGQ